MNIVVRNLGNVHFYAHRVLDFLAVTVWQLVMVFWSCLAISSKSSWDMLRRVIKYWTRLRTDYQIDTQSFCQSHLGRYLLIFYYQTTPSLSLSIRKFVVNDNFSLKSYCYVFKELLFFPTIIVVILIILCKILITKLVALMSLWFDRSYLDHIL